MPPSWAEVTDVPDVWTVSTTSNAGGTPNEMYATWVSGVGVTRLVLGPISTTGATGLRLAFKHYYDDFAAGVTYKIQSSADGVAWTDESWTNASGNGNAGPVTVNTTIANNLGGLTYIAWVLDGDHYNYDAWYIDDVAVTLPLANDVGTNSIDVATNLMPGTIAPQATVKNFGSLSNTFSVQMTITGGYTSTRTVTALAPGATQVVTFDNWVAALGQYTVNVCTQLAGDGDPSNDCLTKDVGVYRGVVLRRCCLPDHDIPGQRRWLYLGRQQLSVQSRREYDLRSRNGMLQVQRQYRCVDSYCIAAFGQKSVRIGDRG